jgi:hypothetical protein
VAAAAGSGSDGVHAAVKPRGSGSGGLFVGSAVNSLMQFVIGIWTSGFHDQLVTCELCKMLYKGTSILCSWSLHFD